MLCVNAVFRLATRPRNTRRNMLSVLCRYQHDHSSGYDQTFQGSKHSRQKRVTSPHNAQKRLARQPQMRPVIIKNIFKSDESPLHEPLKKEPSKEIEESLSARAIADSVSMTEFESMLASVDDMTYSHQDWEELKMKALTENSDLKRSWQTLCMQLMYHHGQTSLASSFLDYLKSNTETSPNISTLSFFVALQGKHGTERKEQIIRETYGEILKITDVFDAITARYLISGLSCTSQWRTALDIIDMVKLTTSPGRSYYSPIIAAAVREQDLHLAFELLDELSMKGMEPQDIVLKEILHACRSGDSHDLLEKYFAYMWKNNWMLSSHMAKEVELYFTRSLKEKWTCKWTTVNTVRGVCHQCRHGLDRIELSSSDFEVLQREFLERALVGSNIYLQSNPQEVERFKDFVMENAPFDVVLDALNIAFQGQGKTSVRKSKQLRDMVHYFAHLHHMKVLVIGRAHMKKWSAADMTYIGRQAKTFFTDDISSDDPFCLYATLYSGRDCLFVSGDFMRNYKYNLGPHYKETFERWQKSRQILNFTVQPTGVSVVMPSQFDCGPVRDNKGWHIPYHDGTVDLRSGTQTVLCLRYKGERKTSKQAKIE